MKKIMLMGAVLMTFASYSVLAQTAGSSGSNTNNASRIGSATVNDPAAIGNDRTSRGQAGSTSNSTVDGSNGGATNDGASGQSGSPAPLPAATASQGTTQTSSSGRKAKKTTSKTSHSTSNHSDHQ